MENYTIFASFGVFVVWMQRHGRFKDMLQAMTNKYTVAGSRRASTSPVTFGGQATKHNKSTPGFRTTVPHMTTKIPLTHSGQPVTTTPQTHLSFWQKVDKILTHPIIPSLKTELKKLGL